MSLEIPLARDAMAGFVTATKDMPDWSLTVSCLILSVHAFVITSYATGSMPAGNPSNTTVSQKI